MISTNCLFVSIDYNMVNSILYLIKLLLLLLLSISSCGSFAGWKRYGGNTLANWQLIEKRSSGLTKCFA